MADATEASVKQDQPAALLKRRLDKSKLTIEQLQKEKAQMEKRMGELLDADKKRKEEDAKAAKISKVVESAGPGAVVHVGRQVNSYWLPCFRVKIVIFCSQKAQAKVKTALAPQVQASLPTTSLFDAYGSDSSYKRSIQNNCAPYCCSPGLSVGPRCASQRDARHHSR